MRRRSYWRPNTKSIVCFFYFHMTTHLPKQDVSGDANTHLGATPRHSLGLWVLCMFLGLVVKNDRPKTYITSTQRVSRLFELSGSNRVTLWITLTYITSTQRVSQVFELSGSNRVTLRITLWSIFFGGKKRWMTTPCATTLQEKKRKKKKKNGAKRKSSLFEFEL